MIDRINSHNQLNGVLFSIIEFSLIALVVAPFATFYLLNAQWLTATISLGILLNCLVMVAYGLYSRLRGSSDGSDGHTGRLSRMWRSKAERARLAAEYPHMATDTIILVVSLLVPYALMAFTLYELIAAGLRGRRSRA